MVCNLLLLLVLGQEPIPGIGPKSPVEKVAGGFAFTEGPAADGLGNLYFSDIPNARIHKLDAKGKVSVFREKSNKANGLMVDSLGRILACEMDGALVALSPDGTGREVLADQHNGKPLNAPNDLVLDKTGGIYFTGVFGYLLFTAAIPLTMGGGWRGAADVIAVTAYLSGIVPLLGMALLDLGLIARGQSTEAKLKLHASLVALFLVVAHVAMIFGMLDPSLLQAGTAMPAHGPKAH